MNRLKRGMLVSLAAGVMLSWYGGAQAQTPEEFYKGKTVNLVISAAPGGAADTLGRIFAPHFAKHIPGQPDLVVLNKPGAGGMKAGSELMVSEAKDGTVVTFLQRNNLINSLLSGKHEQFDPRKVRWIGNLKREPYILVAMKHSPVQNAEEAFQKEMVLAATGFTNENRTLSAMLNEFVGTKFKIVPGYEGTGAIQKAMESGEVDGWMRSLEGSMYGNEKRWIDEGMEKRVLLLGWKRNPDFPDMPALGEFVKDESLKPVIDFFLAPLEVGRPFAVPGDIPEDRLAALRKAFDDTMADPEYIADMAKQNQTVGAMTGQEVEDVIAGLYKTPDNVLEQVRGILIEKK